jgi:uncharacterized membrane protein YadS
MHGSCHTWSVQVAPGTVRTATADAEEPAMTHDATTPAETSDAETGAVRRSGWMQSDDIWAMLIAAVLLVAAWWANVAVTPSEPSADGAEAAVTEYENLLGPWITKPGSWETNPLDAFAGVSGDGGPSKAAAVVATSIGCVVVFALALAGVGVPVSRSVPALCGVTMLAVAAWLASTQVGVKKLQLEYVLWAFAGGLFVSNVIGVPRWLKPALKGELYIKTGLIFMGSGLLFGTLMKLGPPGILISWITTPIVLITTYQFGQRVLKIKSKSLNLVLSADMSVCGVSAAVATAAACRAKKEELSIAVGISLAFTVVMMFAMPAVINAVGLDEVLGGAWIGGTVDSTGAVVAAGELVGPVARDVAASVKLIQNVLIGVISLVVAAVWARMGEDGQAAPAMGVAGGVAEIWKRLPKFVIGFLAASAIFTTLASTGPEGREAMVQSTLKGPIKMMQSWCFCLGFVSIGLETEIRRLASAMGSVKPIILYICGQTLNITLTFVMAYLAFRVVFPDVAAKLMSGGL